MLVIGVGTYINRYEDYIPCYVLLKLNLKDGYHIHDTHTFVSVITSTQLTNYFSVFSFETPRKTSHKAHKKTTRNTSRHTQIYEITSKMSSSNISSRKVALVTGITGQDGSYLAELLLDKGYDVSLSSQLVNINFECA